MLSPFRAVDATVPFDLLRGMPLLPQNAIGCEGRKGHLFLKKLIQRDLRLAVQSMPKWNPSDSGKLEPFMVEPVLNLDKKYFVVANLFEKTHRDSFDYLDELAIVGRICPDDAHGIAERSRSVTRRR
jgi:hypothetical protein